MLFETIYFSYAWFMNSIHKWTESVLESNKLWWYVRYTLMDIIYSVELAINIIWKEIYL
jgi:hypothetical protein